MRCGTMFITWVVGQSLVCSAMAGVLYSHDLGGLKDIKAEGGATCTTGSAPGGKAGNALQISTAGRVKDATASIIPSTTLPENVTVVFRIYIGSYTGDFQGVYNHAPGEGLRFMPGGK